MEHKDNSGLLWLHELVNVPPMPWKVIENDPCKPYMIVIYQSETGDAHMEKVFQVRFRVFRPHAAIVAGDVIW